jgi:hypothetical protein
LKYNIKYHVGYLLIAFTKHYCYRSGIIEITYAFSKCFGIDSISLKRKGAIEWFQLIAYCKIISHKMKGPQLTEKPEKVLIQHNIPATCWLKERCVEITVC